MTNLLAFLSSRDRFLRLLVMLVGMLGEWLYTLQSVPVWRSADGRVTPLTKMGDDHLVKAMALLVRQGTPRPRVFMPMHHEVERRCLGGRVDQEVDMHWRRAGRRAWRRDVERNMRELAYHETCRHGITKAYCPECPR